MKERSGEEEGRREKGEKREKRLGREGGEGRRGRERRREKGVKQNAYYIYVVRYHTLP